MNDARMLTKPIPSSGEALPVIGIGTYKGFDVAGTPENRKRLADVLRLLFEAGGTIVDSSPMYGRAEERAGEALAALGKRDAAFVMTKVWTGGRQAGIEEMRRSLAHFGVERMALMQIHNLVDWQTQLATLREWKAQGVFRYIGLTHYTTGAFGELEKIIAREPVDFLQIPYSIAERAAEARLLPLCREKGVAVIANVPLASGRLLRAARGKSLPPWAAEFGIANWAQFFLKYPLGHEACTCVIPGTGDPEHARDLLGAGLGRPPDKLARAAHDRSGRWSIARRCGTLENLRRALAAIVFALSACAPNEARQAVDPAALPPAARLVALFESVVFRDEYDPKREIERVRKWARPIRISLEGAGPAAFAAAVAEDAGELARLTGLDIRLLPQPDPAAEIRIRFVAWDDMEKEAAEFAPGPDWLGVIVEASACLFIFRRNERWEITRARILVSARERAEHKRRCLLEELYQPA